MRVVWRTRSASVVAESGSSWLYVWWEALRFHDIRVGNDPDARLQKFIGKNLPKVLPEARETFEQYKDLLMSYGSLEIDYTEFAARSRRRSEGRNEDFDEV